MRAAAVRVLVVSHSAGCWGAEQRLLELVPRLAELDVAMVLGTSPESTFAEVWQEGGHEFVPLELPAHTGLRRTDGSGRRPSAGSLARELRAVSRSVAAIVPHARRTHVLHSHSMSAHLEVSVAGKLARTPTVLDVHDIVSPGLGRTVLGLSSILATTALANSAATGETVSSAAAVEVIHPGVDLARFRPGAVDAQLRQALGAQDGDVLVGIIGRVDPIKRIEVAVEALAGSSRRDVKLVIVGSPLHRGDAYAAQLRRLAEGDLSDRVTFTGARHDIPDVMRSLDVLLNTSVAEPFGRSLLEAQAAGVPVIATAGGGVLDFVEDEVTGLLVPPLDAPALRTAIERMAADRDLRSRIGAAGRRQAEERFGVDGQSGRMATLYRGLV